MTDRKNVSWRTLQGITIYERDGTQDQSQDQWVFTKIFLMKMVSDFSKIFLFPQDIGPTQFRFLLILQ